MPLQAPIVLIPILAIISLGNADISDYDGAMKQAPWRVAVNTTQPIDNVGKLKERFAELLLRNPYEPQKAAFAVANGDFGLARIYETQWPNDPLVIEYQKKLISEQGATSFIPSREELIHNIWYRANLKTPQGVSYMEDKDVIASVRLIGELAGYIGKNGAEGNTVNNLVKQSLTVNFVRADNSEQTITVTPNSENVNETDITEGPKITFIS